MAETEHESLTTRAGEYVLGTLDADERARFEGELADDAQARRELAYWERRLGAIGLSLAPVQPPADVWKQIRERAGMGEPQAAASKPAARAPGIGLWRGLAIAASVAALVMAGLLFSGVSPRGGDSAGAPAYASVIYDEPTGMSWLVTAHKGSHKMSVVAMGNYEVPDGKVLRLWFKADSGEPVLLGEWPHSSGDYEMTVPDAAAESMDQPAKLMVSMENAGSANQSSPEGRLMWTSPIARRTG